MGNILYRAGMLCKNTHVYSIEGNPAIVTRLWLGKTKSVHCPAQTLDRKSSTGTVFNLVPDCLIVGCHVHTTLLSPLDV